MNDQELRTQLWDYVYGLMEPAEAAALEVRIKSDPRLARMYAETRLESDLLAGAARLEQPPIPLTTRVAPATATTQRFRTVRSAGRAAWANWITGLAAVLLIGLFAYGWQPRQMVATAPLDTDGVSVGSFAMKPSEPIIVDVSGPVKAAEGLANSFVIQTRDAHDAPKSVEMTCQVVDAKGRTDFESQVTTDANGMAKWSVPGSAMREHRRIMVQAKDQAADVPPVVAPLEVVADAFQAHLEVDREVSQPGETVFFRAVVLGEKSRVESEALDAEFVLLDPDGKPVPGSEAKDTTVRGVAKGEVVIPSNAGEGQYEVLVRSPQDEFDEQRIPVHVQREAVVAFGAGAPLLAMNANRAQDKLKRTDGEESESASKAERKQNDLRSAGEGKPQAADAANAPAPKVALAGDAPAPGGQPEAGAKELAQGVGRGNVEKKLAEQSPAIVRRGDPNRSTPLGGGKAGAAPGEGGSGGTGGGGGVNSAAPAPNAFRFESQTADRKSALGDKTRYKSVDDLAAAQSFGDQPLADQSLADQPFAKEGKKLKDAAKVVREAVPALVVKLEDRPQSFAPGQEVSLRLETKTEAGEQVSAVLGVRVVNADFVSFDAEPAPVSGELLSGSATAAQDAQQFFGQRGAQRFSGPAPVVSPAEATADALAKGKADRSFANAAPAAERDRRAGEVNTMQVTLGSNRDLVAREVERFKWQEQSHNVPAAETHGASDAGDLRPLGRGLLVGGLLGLTAIGVMFVVRLPVRVWFWAPALLAATACLTLGIVRLAPRHEMLVENRRGENQAESQLKQLGEPLTETLEFKRHEAESLRRGEDSLGLPIAPRELRDGAQRGRDETDGSKFEERAKNQVAGRQLAAAKDNAPRGPAATEKAAEVQNDTAAAANPAVPPATLLWNPRLVTDEHGAARITFRLPEQPGRYRVQVQGHADGRLGATEFVIQTHSPALAAPAEPAPAEPAAPAKPQPPVESKE